MDSIVKKSEDVNIINITAKDEETGLVNTDIIMWKLLIKHGIEKGREYHPFIRAYLAHEFDYSVSFWNVTMQLLCNMCVDASASLARSINATLFILHLRNCESMEEKIIEILLVRQLKSPPGETSQEAIHTFLYVSSL